MRNTFGTLYTLTTFGESHGEGVGGVIDGMPSGVAVDEAASFSESWTVVAQVRARSPRGAKSPTRCVC